MRISPHMIRIYNPKSRGGQILKEIDRIVAAEKPEGLWLEWVPASIVPRRDGFRIKRVENGGNNDSWELIIPVAGELKYLARLGNVSKNLISEIRRALTDRSIPERCGKESKPLEETTMKKSEGKPASQVIDVVTPLPVASEDLEVAVPAQTAAQEKPKSSFRTDSNNAELVLMAIEDIIQKEKIKATFGWYKIPYFSTKVLNIVIDPKITSKVSARFILQRILDKLEKDGKIEVQRKDRERSVRVRFPGKPEKAPAPAAEVQKEEPAAVQPSAEPSPQVAALIGALKNLRYLDLMELRKCVNADADLKTLISLLS